MVSNSGAVEGVPRRGYYAPVMGPRITDPTVGRGRGGGERMFERIREREGERPGFCGSRRRMTRAE
jgi:hypothetical protein